MKNSQKAIGSSQPAYISIKKSAVGTPSAAVPPANKSPHAALPVSLKQYVDRVFAACPASKLNQVQSRLKLLITRAQETNTLHTTDWTQMPLPDFSNLDSSEPAKVASDSNPPSSDASPHTSTPPTPKSYSAAILSMGKFKRKATADESPAKGSLAKKAMTNHHSSPSVSPRTALKNALSDFGVSSRSSSPVGIDDSRKNDRLKRFKLAEEERQRQKVKENFEIEKARQAFQMAGAEGNPDVIDWDEHTIIGTCTKLEKSYLRLTSAPDPASVRPLQILIQTLELLKQKWKKEHNYTYICDQFKSLRQDLTVQRIKNEFTVKVYETHARIALEKGDLGEYNQCQAQLKQLYHIYHLPGCTEEFLAYRILYMIHTMNQRDLTSTISHLTPKERQGTPVQHALAVRSALATGNYQQFFQLYHQAPNMSGYLMDQFAERQRFLTLRALCRAFRPDLSLEYVASHLGFIEPNLSLNGSAEHDSKAILRGVRACQKWLSSVGVTLLTKPSTASSAVDTPSASNPATAMPFLDCKSSLALAIQKVVEMERKGVDIKGQIH